MKIVTWNVNSIKMRREHVLDFLKSRTPDVLMLQELKGLEFPAADFEALGYHTVSLPQKAYNGVAIISREPAQVILNHLEDEHARYLETDIAGLRVINIYLPNGNPVFSESQPDPGFRRDDTFSVKFDYKLGWMEKLFARLKGLRAQNIPFLIGGDFNVIPEGKDCYDPPLWANDALYRIETRAAFRRLLNLGLTDAFRIWNANDQEYTFWDYFALSWPNNKGLRIDHFLLSPELTDRAVGCTIDREPRGWDKSSDHTPVILEIAA
ncbi:MAG: exodeoxyribonuclease III [Alphaproteobacteria bacterium]